MRTPSQTRPSIALMARREREILEHAVRTIAEQAAKADGSSRSIFAWTVTGGSPPPAAFASSTSS